MILFFSEKTFLKYSVTLLPCYPILLPYGGHMIITQAVKSIATYLRLCLERDAQTLRYKSTIEPENFETIIPEIYCFTMPSSKIIESYPAKCPCICITLDGRNDHTYDITLHLCISNASRNEQEMATQVIDEETQAPIPNRYELGEGDKYDTEADEDLLIESVLFTDQIADYIYNYVKMDLTDIVVQYIDPSLPDYPYAVSTVAFKLNVNMTHNGQNPYNALY